MNRTTQAALLALFLTAVGFAIFTHKVITANVPLLPSSALQSWYVEAKIVIAPSRSLLGDRGTLPQTIRTLLPQSSERYAIAREGFRSQGFSRSLEAVPDSHNRRAVFSKEASGSGGERVLFYRAVVDELPGSWSPVAFGQNSVGRDFVSDSSPLQRRDRDEVRDNLAENLPTEEIQTLIVEARTASGGERLRFAENLYRLVLDREDVRVRAIDETLGGELSAAELAVFLLDRAGVRARIGNGIPLVERESYSTDFVRWMEVFADNRWQAYDAVSGRFGPQDRYLVWWYGDVPVVSTANESEVQIEVSVRPNTDSGLSQTIWQDRAELTPFVRYSFLGLPIGTQRVFQVLVLVPIGALVVSLLHQVVGIKTFGTFTPILIALAFRETGLLLGIALFVLIVALGLLIRLYLNQLQLLVVPRLAVILTATVLLVGALAIAADTLGLQLGLSVSLFPIVILAMTIEKAALMWEEEGGREVTIATVGSVAIATVGYLLMTNSYTQHLVFTFPELLLGVLAANILVGRYSGYKLSEYLRFRAMQAAASSEEAQPNA